MNYLLYGTEKYLINKEIEKIKVEHKFEDSDISSYDLNINHIEEVIEDASTISLFGSKKLIIIKNSFVFSTKKLILEQNTDILEKYLANPNPDSILVFIMDEGKIDERKKIVVSIKTNGTIKEYDKPYNIENLIITMFDDYVITRELARLLISRVGNNLEVLSNEIDKLKIYKDNDKNILKEDILNLTTENIDTDVFVLIDYIIKKDISSAIKIYNEMSKYNIEPIEIIVILSKKIRSLYQTKEMYKLGYTEKDIALELGVKPGALYYMRDSLNKYDSETLLYLLEELAELDYNIKSGKVLKDIGLEIFILNLAK